MISVYAEFARNIAAMPVVVGRKSRSESFAGADSTYTIEAMMGDRRALQVLLSSAHTQEVSKSTLACFRTALSQHGEQGCRNKPGGFCCGKAGKWITSSQSTKHTMPVCVR